MKAPQPLQGFSAFLKSPSTSVLTTINSPQYNHPTMITVSKEDYLKSILEAETEGEAVISARLAQSAESLSARRNHGPSPPEKRWPWSASKAAAKFASPPTGRKIARKLTLRHHLIERMLSEMFGMEWWKVHDEAERLEHAVSPDFEAKLLAKLGSGEALPARKSK